MPGWDGAMEVTAVRTSATRAYMATNALPLCFDVAGHAEKGQAAQRDGD